MATRLVAKKCPNCGLVKTYEAGSLTICDGCGEVLAESWALADAVTDIVDGGAWIQEFRKSEGVGPLGAAQVEVDRPPGMIGPSNAPQDQFFIALGGGVREAIKPPLPAFPPVGPAPEVVAPAAAPPAPLIVQGAPLAQAPRAEPELHAQGIKVVGYEPSQYLAPDVVPLIDNPEELEPISRPRIGPVREKNVARSAAPGAISSELSLNEMNRGKKVVLVPLTSPGVKQTINDLIQGTGAFVRPDAIDTRPILAVHGLDAEAAQTLSERLERVGIPSKVKAADPGPSIRVVESTTRSWLRTVIAGALALSVIAGVILFLVR